MIPLFKSRVAFFAVGLFLIVASVASAQYWTPPPANFPAGNVSVPITIGTSTQWKNGVLYVNQLRISPTSSPFTGIVLPAGRQILGLNVSGTQNNTFITPYNSSWGLFLQSDTTTGGNGFVTLLSGSQANMNNPARSSVILMRPDGRIVTSGVFVLPNTATTSVATTARVPGAMVYTNGAPYFYKNAIEGWLPVGSGGTVTGGTAAGWLLTPSGSFTTPSVLFTTSTSRSVKVGINTTVPSADLDVRGDVRIAEQNFNPSYFSNYYYKYVDTLNSAATYTGTITFSTFRDDPTFRDTFSLFQTGFLDDYRITIARTGGIGANTCEDMVLDNIEPECPAAEYDSAGDVAPNAVYDFRRYYNGRTGYNIAVDKFIKTPVDGRSGGNLSVAGSVSASGGINSPRMFSFGTGWHALRWTGSPLTVGQIRSEINNSKGSVSTNVVGDIYKVNPNTSAYIGPILDTELVQPGDFIVFQLTARKNVTTLSAEIAPEWSLKTGSVDTSLVTAREVDTRMLCIRDDCRIAWPVTGSGGGGGFWASTTGTGVPIYYNAGKVGIGTMDPTYRLDVQSNVDGGARTRFSNISTGVNSRADLMIGAGGGTDAIYLGIDKGNTFGTNVKAYLDNRSGGKFAFLTNGINPVTIDTNGNVGIGATTTAAKLTINSDSDEMIQLNRSGVVSSTQFRMGVADGLGNLVVNTSGKDALFIEDGKVSIGGNVGSELLEVQGGNLSVNTDPLLTGFVYESNTAIPGVWDPGHTLVPKCECEVNPNSASDCADTFYADNGTSSYCYNYSQAYDESRNGYFDISYTYDRISTERQAKGGIGQFQNKVVIGHPSVGTTPMLQLKPAGSPSYTISNSDGTVRFRNTDEAERFALGQDGAIVAYGQDNHVTFMVSPRGQLTLPGENGGTSLAMGGYFGGLDNRYDFILQENNGPGTGSIFFHGNSATNNWMMGDFSVKAKTINLVSDNGINLVNASGRKPFWDGLKWVPDGMITSCNFTVGTTRYRAEAQQYDGVIRVRRCTRIGSDIASCDGAGSTFDLRIGWKNWRAAGVPDGLTSSESISFGQVVGTLPLSTIRMASPFSQLIYFNYAIGECTASF